MRQDTVILILSALCCLEDHVLISTKKAIELAQGGGQALSVAALAGHSPSRARGTSGHA